MEKTLRLPSSLFESLQQVEMLVTDIYNKHRVSPQTYGNMLVTLSEAVTNAILHGNHSDKSKEVEVSYIIDDSLHKVEFRVKDEGDGFDCTKVPDPTMVENIYKVNGRGVMIMNSLADDVSFTDNGTVVVLKFKLDN